MDSPDLQSALPGPRNDEPPMLRKDIADELADHLTCAMKRELRRTDDAPVAHRTVLDKFGNPASIARKLYLDAMKEQIMKDRILLTAVVLLTLISLASVALSWQAMSQGRQMNEALLAKIQTINAAKAVNYDWTEAVFKIVKGTETGPPAEKWHVQLSGWAFNPADKVNLEKDTGPDGTAHFGPIKPGTYTLLITSEWKDSYRTEVMILPGPPFTQTIVGPSAPRTVGDVQFEVKWPDDLKDKGLWVLLRMDLGGEKSGRYFAGTWWGSVYRRVVYIGPRQQIVEPIGGQGDLFGTGKPSEESSQVGQWPLGVYEVHINSVQFADEPHDRELRFLTTATYGGQWPKWIGKFTVVEKQANRWTIEPPESVVTLARQALAKVDTNTPK